MSGLDDIVLQSLYMWVDKVPLSRVKKNIARDFSDGVMMAELMKHFFPKFVNTHNFTACNSIDSKKKNWQLLNWKVFKKLNFELSDDVIESLAAAKPGTIEKVLLLLKTKIERMVTDESGRVYDCRPESDRFKTPPRRRISPGKPRLKKSSSLQMIPRNASPTPAISSRHIQNRISQVASGHMFAGDHSPAFSGVNVDFVTREAFEEKMHECLHLEETVEILTAKIRRLEHLLRLKDNRIDDLQKTLGGPRVKMIK
ncbi:Sperm flagellar protein 1 [Fasciolopsis buskii]|uniref:Sperm flagellar protein 1 n=1 Tax=Fasciolopsis buskii TaxID=27845 RepID=A0A8E0RX75_9TREM|nr:Sperm flagellar protein 1 [Fasciolopsis buski]